MGSRGPAPKPTALKVIQGNPGKRRLNHREPAPTKRSRTPPAPSALSEKGKAEWKRVARILHEIGLLTKLDEDALVVYCEAYATWREATDAFRKFGMVIKTVNGFPVQSPYLAIANRAQAEMVRLLKEFGMTPSSRSRVTVEKAEEPSEFERFLARK